MIHRGLPGCVIFFIVRADSSRGPTLRPTLVRAVPGCRRGTRSALKPAHGDAAARQDPRGRSRNAARRQQPRDRGVLSGAVDVR